MANLPVPPAKPTVYVVGSEPVDEGFLDVLPEWASRFGHRSTAIEPVAPPTAANAGWYRNFVDFIRDEYHAAGAIMLSQASTLFEHTQQMFDEFDDDVPLLGEIGVALRAPGTLSALAPAKQAARQAYAQTFGSDDQPPEVLIIGATRPARALALALSDSDDETGPPRVCLTTLDGKSMTEMRQRVADLPDGRRPVLRHIESQIEHDRLLTLLPPGSLVVNASGPVAKDTKSPVGDAALFPENGLVWDLDAVGISSPFLDKARQQRRPRGLRLADGPIFHQYQWLAAAAAVFGSSPTRYEAEKLRELID